MADSSSVQAVQSPRLTRPMWMHSVGGGGGGPHFVAHNLGLNQTTPSSGSGNLVPSFAPKTPCEGIAVMSNNSSNNNNPLQPSSLEKVSGVVTTLVVPDRVRVPYRHRHTLINGKFREYDEKWLSQMQEHFVEFPADHPLSPFLPATTQRSIKRVKRKALDHDITYEMEEEDSEEEALRDHNFELESSVLDEPQNCDSSHVRVPSFDQVNAHVTEKVQANVLKVPIADSKAASRRQDLVNCKPRSHVGLTLLETERHEEQCRRISTPSLCPPTMQDNGGGTGVFATRKNFQLVQEAKRDVSMCSLRTPQMAPDADRKKVSSAKPPPQSVQETVPGSFLSSRSSQMLQQGADPGSPFPLQKVHGLQELDPGSSLGVRTPQVMEGFSGRVTGSLYSSALSIPTRNPALKSSSVGMMECQSPRGKGPRKAWEGNIFVEAGESENGRESMPLAWSGSKLHAVPAHAPMPAAKQTLSSGEPSLLLTLNFSPMPPGSMGLSLKTSTAVLASPEEDWGKMLALSQTPATTPAEAELTEHKLLGYQERFIRLQAYLKKCDDNEQGLLQALQSLSAAARSGHAVELETRALGLSLEEVKEMDRLKMLNVMGCGPISRGQHELGRAPTGPRLPGISTTLESGHQIHTKSSPQLSAPMPAQAAAVPHFL